MEEFIYRACVNGVDVSARSEEELVKKVMDRVCKSKERITYRFNEYGLFLVNEDRVGLKLQYNFSTKCFDVLCLKDCCWKFIRNFRSEAEAGQFCISLYNNKAI